LSKDKVSKKIFSVKSITKFAQIIIQIIFFASNIFIQAIIEILILLKIFKFNRQGNANKAKITLKFNPYIYFTPYLTSEHSHTIYTYILHFHTNATYYQQTKITPNSKTKTFLLITNYLFSIILFLLITILFYILNLFAYIYYYFSTQIIIKGSFISLLSSHLRK